MRNIRSDNQLIIGWSLVLSTGTYLCTCKTFVMGVFHLYWSNILAYLYFIDVAMHTFWGIFIISKELRILIDTAVLFSFWQSFQKYSNWVHEMNALKIAKAFWICKHFKNHSNIASLLTGLEIFSWLSLAI